MLSGIGGEERRDVAALSLSPHLQWLQNFVGHYSISSSLTWLKNFVVRTVCHIQASKFYADLIAPGFAHSERYLHHVGTRLLKYFLGHRNIHS